MHKIVCLDPGTCLVHYRDRTSCKVQSWHCTKYHQDWPWGPKFRSEPRLHFFSKDSCPPSTTWSPLRNRAVSFWKKLMDRVRHCSFLNVCILQPGELWPEQRSQWWTTRRPFQRCRELSALVRCSLQWLPVMVFGRRSPDKFPPVNRPHFLVFPFLHSVFGSVRWGT